MAGPHSSAEGCLVVSLSAGVNEHGVKILVEHLPLVLLGGIDGAYGNPKFNFFFF